MEKKNSTLLQYFIIIAISGNILFMAWITYNAIKEHFSGNMHQKIIYLFLMGLLIINSWIILSNRRKI